MDEDSEEKFIEGSDGSEVSDDVSEDSAKIHVNKIS
jgi:hypothetical protein